MGSSEGAQLFRRCSTPPKVLTSSFATRCSDIIFLLVAGFRSEALMRKVTPRKVLLLIGMSVFVLIQTLHRTRQGSNHCCNGTEKRSLARDMSG